MVKAKKKPVSKVEKKVVRFKDLKLDEVFNYKGDECFCEGVKREFTIFTNKKENKRYRIESDKVVE